VLKETVFIDMDGVLVDFIGGMEKVFGIPIKEHLDPKVYDITPTMEKLLNRKISSEEFWGPINDNLDFWKNLEPLPWYKEVILLVEKHFGDNWFILTSPHNCVKSYEGKLIWLRKHIDPKFDFGRAIMTPHKHLLASNASILIDDSPPNCYKFMLPPARGLSFMFPAPNNSLHFISKHPIPHMDTVFANFTYLRDEVISSLKGGK